MEKLNLKSALSNVDKILSITKETLTDGHNNLNQNLVPYVVSASANISVEHHPASDFKQYLKMPAG